MIYFTIFIVPEFQGEPDDISREKCKVAAREVGNFKTIEMEKWKKKNVKNFYHVYKVYTKSCILEKVLNLNLQCNFPVRENCKKSGSFFQSYDK